MGAQILVTHMSKADVTKKIAELKAGDLLTVGDGPDSGTLLVCCRPNEDGLGDAPGAHDALQALADEDSARVRAEATKREAAAAKREAETPPTNDEG